MSAAGQRGCDLDQQRRFADAGIAAEEQDRAAHEAATGDAIEFGEPRGESRRVAPRAGKRLERKRPPLARRTAGPLWARGTLLGNGVPFATGLAFALPAAVSRAAVLADEVCVATSHGPHIAHFVPVRVRHPRARSIMAQRPRRLRPESLALVDPVVALSEIGENLVANSPHAGGELVDADAVADQGGKIAAARGALGKIGDVDGQ